MLDLTELQHDALVEIFNIGVGHAANALSAIVQEEVTMSVPTISFRNRAEAASILSNDEERNICGVRQNFNGALNTEALLMFPEEKSLEIVRLMVGSSLSMQELTEMEQEAMSEVGNIILNACVGVLANVFNHNLHGSLPSYHIGSSGDLLSTDGSQDDDVVLMLHIDIQLEKHQIVGHIAFLMDVTSLHDLRTYLDQYLSGLIN